MIDDNDGVSIKGITIVEVDHQNEEDLLDEGEGTVMVQRAEVEEQTPSLYGQKCGQPATPQPFQLGGTQHLELEVVQGDSDLEMQNIIKKFLPQTLGEEANTSAPTELLYLNVRASCANAKIGRSAEVQRLQGTSVLVQIDNGSQITLGSRELHRRLVESRILVSLIFRFSSTARLRDYDDKVHDQDAVRYGFYLFLRFRIGNTHFLHPVLVHIRDQAKDARLVAGKVLCKELALPETFIGLAPYDVEGDDESRRLGVVTTVGIKVPLHPEMRRSIGELRTTVFQTMRTVEIRSGGPSPMALDKLDSVTMPPVRMAATVAESRWVKPGEQACEKQSASEASIPFNTCVNNNHRELQGRTTADEHDKTDLTSIGLQFAEEIVSQLIALKPTGIQSAVLAGAIIAWIDPNGSECRDPWRQSVTNRIYAHSNEKFQIHFAAHNRGRWSCGLTCLLQIGAWTLHKIDCVKNNEIRRVKDVSGVQIVEPKESELTRQVEVCELLRWFLDPLSKCVDSAVELSPQTLGKEADALVDIVGGVYYTAMQSSELARNLSDLKIGSFIRQKPTEESADKILDLSIEDMLEATEDLQAVHMNQALVKLVSKKSKGWWLQLNAACGRAHGGQRQGFGVNRLVAEPRSVPELVKNGLRLDTLTGPTGSVAQSSREELEVGTEIFGRGATTAIVRIDNGSEAQLEILQDRLLASVINNSSRLRTRTDSLGAEANSVLKRCRKLLGDKDKEFWEEVINKNNSPEVGTKRKERSSDA